MEPTHSGWHMQQSSDHFRGFQRDAKDFRAVRSIGFGTGHNRLLGVTAMDNSVQIMTVVEASIIHACCALRVLNNQLIAKLRNRNHERIPNRVVHAKDPTRGTGAWYRLRLSVGRQRALSACRCYSCFERGPGLPPRPGSRAAGLSPIRRPYWRPVRLPGPAALYCSQGVRTPSSLRAACAVCQCAQSGSVFR